MQAFYILFLAIVGFGALSIFCIIIFDKMVSKKKSIVKKEKNIFFN